MRNIDIYIGQSNMTGTIPITEARTDNQSIYGWDSINNIWVNNPHHEEGIFHAQVAMGRPEHVKDMVGCEMTCSRFIAQQTNTTRHVIKFSWGGSPISDWHPDTGPHYAKILSMCRAANISSNDNVTVFWMQGESDTQDNRSNSYLENMKFLESRLKTDMHMSRFIIGRITLEPWSTYDGADAGAKEIRLVQEQFDYVDTDSFPKKPEENDRGNPPAHYSPEGTRMLGMSFAMSYLHKSSRVYRLHNPQSRIHYFTLSSKESISMIRQGWSLEDGEYTYSMPEESDKTTPYYRAYNPNTGEYLWTSNIDEYNAVRSFGWNQDGIDGNIFKSHELGSYPLYRLFNSTSGLHHWTANEDEKTRCIDWGWTYEGIVGYVIK